MASENIVLIPCFNRAEFLAVTLELINKAELADTMTYIFQIDFGYEPEILEVINNFKLDKVISYTPEHEYPNKQSYSLLKGYEVALSYNPKHIFLIEDDIFIANDFFHWHLKNIGDNFASIATLNHNTRQKHSNNLGVTYTESEYQSLGVCFHADSVRQFLSIVTEDYYTNPQGFIKKHFPASRIPVGYCEQDGLIRRYIQRERKKVVFPHVPRAFHAGFYGKSRGEKLTGNLAERINEVKFTAFDPEIMTGDSKPEILANPIY